MQNCSGFINLPLDNLGQYSKRIDRQAILYKEFVANGGHLVTFYEQEDSLKANMQVNPLHEVNKFYSEVDVIVEAGVTLAELPNLDKKVQQRRIQVMFSKDGKPQSIIIHKPWLMGGMMNNSPKEVIMFCGNPGVGKSTICNSIFGQAIFKSGVSLGKGLTTHKQEHIHEEKLYIDTPGLDDVDMHKQAAVEIEKALKHNNNYKIVFVATLEEGRIRPADLVTINAVCDAIKDKFEYGIIFNKVIKKIITKIEEAGVNQEILNQYLATLHKKPSSVIILKKDNDMEGEDDVYFQGSDENRQKLVKFLESLKANRIEENNVKKIDISYFQAKIEEMEKSLKKTILELEKTIAEQRKEIRDLKNKDNSGCILL